MSLQYSYACESDNPDSHANCIGFGIQTIHNTLAARVIVIFTHPIFYSISSNIRYIGPSKGKLWKRACLYNIMIPKMIRFILDYSRNIYFHMLVEGSLCRLKLDSEFKFYVSFKFDNQQIFSKIIELANYII